MTEFETIRSKIDSYCGLCCESCEYKTSMNCGGCIATQGHPFHGVCELAQCAIQRNRGFCGECPDFPCQLLKRYSHDPEHGDGGARIARCTQLKQALVKSAREGVDMQGVCGHHCDHCPFTQWCGGCRSVYPHCSFATLYADCRCPNAACAEERQLDGCYDCPGLADCSKGYFGVDDGYTAKGAAVFIARHGKGAYADMLARAGERPDGIQTAEELCTFWEQFL